jgi:hypothetical protein
MSTTNDFASSNLAGTRTSLTNGQYLIWGHNGAVTNAWNAAGIPSADNVINRVWQVQNTKSVGAVYFQIDLNAYPALQGAAGTFALMVNNSTNFSSGTTLYLLTHTTGSLYIASGVTFPTGTSYFTIGQRKFWVGNSGTTWATAANWSSGSIPLAGTNIEFATASNNGAFPAVSNWVLDNDYTIGNLTNLSSQQVVIPPGLSLTVNGTVTTANANNIYIRSAQGQANGSFIFPNATNVLATVEMYSKAHSVVTGIEYPLGSGKLSRYSWQYFGIPVDSITASPTFDGSYVRSLYEPGTDPLNHWVQLNNLSKLAPFYGYEMTQDVTTGKLIVFQGHLKNKNWTSPIQVRTGATGVLFPGQYLFANPYTAAIDIQKFISHLGSDTGGNVYLYSTGSLVDWGTTGSQGSANGTSAGQYQVVTSATGTGIPTQIPSMQAVLVQMKTGGLSGSTVTFNYSDIVKNTDFQRVKSNVEVSAPTMSYTMIDINGSGYSDRMWIFSGSTFTHRYDRGWDGPKLMGIELAPQLYALEQDGNYQIDCVDDMNNTVLGFQRGVDTVYTLTFTHQNLSGKYAGIYLADLVENKTVDITQSGSTYSFVADSTSTPVKRFLILTRGIENVATNAELKLFNSGNSIYIQNSGKQFGELVIYDMMGRAIKKAKFGPYGVTTVKTGAVPGAYVVNAATGTERVNKKVIIGE